MSPVPPVIGQTNPGTSSTDFNVFDFLFNQALQKYQTITLVKVISCTNAGELSPVGRVVVQPLVFQMTGGRQASPHGEIHDIPYFRLQGGHNAYIIDPEPDDIGMAAFCSRDIANIKSNPAAAIAAGGATPGSLGTFDWADGLYLGGYLNGVPTQYIRFSEDGIEIVSPTKITLRAPIVEIDAATEFTVAAVAVDIEATADARLSGATAELGAIGTAQISGAAIVLAGPVSQTGGGAAAFSGSIDAPTVTSQGTVLHTHGHNPGTLEIAPNPVTGLAGTPT